MKLVQWTRFAWDLEKMGEPATGRLPVNTVVRPAQRRELDVVQAVIVNSFTLDSDWAESYRRIKDKLAEQVRLVFEAQEIPGLVLAHGSRLVGASVFSVNPASECHLLSGPCILLEYRNRGLGTDLLWRSLQAMKVEGVKRAFGITRKGVPAEKFVYPKFAGAGEPVDLPPEFLA